ncbi:MAG TPA: pentapeptide repeat-containing protein [Segetibacter sp.]
MKKLSPFFVVLLLVPALSIAQTTVSAESIKAKINANSPIALSNVHITGDLDLTKLANMKLVPQKDSESMSKTFVSTVTSPVSFTNCTFTGNVLGYFNPDNVKGNLNLSMKESSEVYNTNFEALVAFENCTFEKEVAFKYSEFKNKLSFAGSKFNDEATFKYTKFTQGPNFAGADFKNIAIFKYVELPGGFDFSNAVFNNQADFKYAKFLSNGSLANARFRSSSDFKYANFSNAVNLKGTRFEGATDFKYTKRNNRQTTLSELTER